MEPQQIDPNKPLTLTRTAQDWSTAIALMNTGTRWLMESMVEGLNRQSMMPTNQPPPPSDASHRDSATSTLAPSPPVNLRIWRECISESAEACGVTLTQQQIDYMAYAALNEHENFEMVERALRPQCAST